MMDPSPNASMQGQFATTQWPVVLRAAQSADTEGFAALSALCGQYWYPLYAFIRRSGYEHQAAQDLTQGFFEHLLSTNGLQAANSEKGRFRSFLLRSVKNYLANTYHRDQTQKRGGAVTQFSLDDSEAAERYQFEPVDKLTPEALYERRWALTLIEQVLAKVRVGFAVAHRDELFDALKPALLGEAKAGYAEVAKRFGTTEGAIKVMVHRLRQRFRSTLEEMVGQTVNGPEEIQDEIRFLIAALERA